MKWDFLIVTEDYGVFGTDSLEEAEEACEDFLVYNLLTGKCLSESDPENKEIAKWKD